MEIPLKCSQSLALSLFEFQNAHEKSNVTPGLRKGNLNYVFRKQIINQDILPTA